MADIRPYLVFNGTCEAAFLFYSSVFQIEIPYLGRFKDMNKEDGPEMSASDGEKVMHVTLPIAENFDLMGSDTNSQSGDVIMGSNVSLSINTKSKDEADKLFNGLSSGGIIKMPMQDTFWNAYFGMFTDKLGIHWMVNFDKI